jgi:hypothetical protein
MYRRIVCLLVAGCLSFAAFAQQQKSSFEISQLEIPNVGGAMQIDGNFDETQWQSAKVIQLNYVTRPFENTRPPVATEVRIFENSDTLYVAFTAQDPEIKDISAFYRDRDRIWNDDLVG